MRDGSSNSKSEFLNSTAFWTIVTIVCGAIVAFSVLYLSQQRRALSYSYETSAVINKNDKSIKIQFNDMTVDKVYITDLEIKNTGKQAIRGSEIVDTLKVDLADGCKLLTANPIAANPPNLLGGFSSEVTFNSRSALFKPKLLNPKDSVTIRMISSGCDSVSPIASGRIEGIAAINADSAESEFPGIFLFIGVCIITLAVLLITVGDPDINLIKNKINSIKEDIDRLEANNLYNDPVVGNKIEIRRSHIDSHRKEIRFLRSHPTEWGKKRYLQRNILMLIGLSIIALYFVF